MKNNRYHGFVICNMEPKQAVLFHPWNALPTGFETAQLMKWGERTLLALKKFR